MKPQVYLVEIAPDYDPSQLEGLIGSQLRNFGDVKRVALLPESLAEDFAKLLADNRAGEKGAK